MMYNFSSWQLLCMAGLAEKSSVYGISDRLTGASAEQLSTEVKNELLSLVEQEIAEIDFDGNVSLRPEYEEIIHFICDCEQCLVFVIKKDKQTDNTLIFWRIGNRYLMADVIGECYVFSKTDAAMVRAYLPTALWECSEYKMSSDTVLPQIALTKAVRLCRKNQVADALRILRQNGADHIAAKVIVDGLVGDAFYIGIHHMDNCQERVCSTEKQYLNSRGITLMLSQAIVNLRTCTVFTGVDLENVRSAIETSADAFLAEHEEG